MAAPMGKNTETFVIKFSGNSASILSKWKVKKEYRVSPGTPLALYEIVNGLKNQRLKSNEIGVIDELLVEEGQVVNPGDELIRLRGCDHPVVMKDMCAECGADLRVESGFSGERKEQSSASVAMVHSIPELIVSEQQALELGKEDESRLLQTNKLVLLVDLDQTVLHTTNDNVPNNLKDVIHFQLWHANQLIWYHTKFRPGTRGFLERMSKLYELHICTFGARMYAHTMARHLDPDGKFFSQRILSRDECFNPMSKTANLRALFPCGDSMVCIIDDREDIWNYAPHLVHVKPYRFFKGTADINAPPGMDKTDDVSQEIHADDVLHQAGKIQEGNGEHREGISEKEGNGEPKEGDSVAKQDSGEGDSTMEAVTTDVPDLTENGTEAAMGDTDVKDSVEEMEVETEETSDGKEGNYEDSSKKSENPELNKEDNKEAEDMIEWDDPDDYLLYLEDILTRIHKAYYDLYAEHINNKTSSIPDLKNIIPYVKKKVLKGVNLCFSGVVPKNLPSEQCKAWQLAKSLGANIQDEFVRKGDSATTHVVAAKFGTSKVNQALRDKRVKLVSVDWLWCCAHRWERVEEELFPLKQNSSEVAVDSPIAKVKRKHDDEIESPSEKRMKMNSEDPSTSFKEEISPMLKFSKEDLDSMDQELHDLIGSDTSDSDDDDDDDSEKKVTILEESIRKKVLSGEAEESSSSAESLSGDFPKGWRHQFKRRHSWPSPKDKDDSDDESSDDNKTGYKVKMDRRERSLMKKVIRTESLSDDDDEDDNVSTDVESIGSVDEEMAEAVEREFLN